jgi:hypothetical protein
LDEIILQCIIYYKLNSNIKLMAYKEKVHTQIMKVNIHMYTKFIFFRNVTLADRKKIISDEIYSWLTCNIASLSMRTLSDGHHRQHETIMSHFEYCSKDNHKAKQKSVITKRSIFVRQLN